MTTLKDRFAMLQSLKPDITQAEIARIAGVKPPSVNGWFSGETKSLKADSATKVASIYGVNPHWLATGEGEMVAGEEGESRQAVASPTPTTVRQTIDRLGELLMNTDGKTRAAVADLLVRYAQDPAEGGRLAQAIELLLDAQEERKE